MKIKRFNESSIDWEVRDKAKIKYYNQIFALFLDKLPDEELLMNYIREEDDRFNNEYTGEASLAVQDFVNLHLKSEFNWVTGIGIMDAADQIVEDAYGNGNIKDGQ